jgi:hypothetical protein
VEDVGPQYQEDRQRHRQGHEDEGRAVRKTQPWGQERRRDRGGRILNSADHHVATHLSTPRERERGDMAEDEMALQIELQRDGGHVCERDRDLNRHAGLAAEDNRETEVDKGRDRTCDPLAGSFWRIVDQSSSETASGGRRRIHAFCRA